jgi:hypothetical protein
VGERTGLIVLFESAVEESSQNARSNVLLSKAAEDLKFLLSVNQMVDLGAVDAQKKLSVISIS